MLSKSDYLKYLQCKKYLWLYKYRKDLAETPSESQQHIFEQGYEVEDLAKKLFKPGVEVKENFAKGRAETTQLVIKGHEVIYQATAYGEDLMARADILIYNKEAKSWDIYEVKSSTEVKDEYIPDLTFQKIAFERSGTFIGKTYLVHINHDYVRKGKIDPKKFFKIEDLTETVNAHIRWVKADIPQALEFLKEKKMPEVQILKQCKKPNPCPFAKYCWKDIPENSVYNLTRIREDLLKILLQTKIMKITDIHERFPLTEKQKNQILAAKTKKPIIDKEAIKRILDNFEYPLYFLDYETFAWAIPAYDGTKPYQSICFQYSLHVIEKKGGKLEHYEFLSTTKDNPIPALLKSLKKDIKEEGGTVLVWYKPFETSRNSEMAEMYPKYRKFLESVNDRVFDLMEIFSKQHYVHPDFHGSCSIKKVLPAMVKGISHKDLEIHEGGTASLKWHEMVFNTQSKTEQIKIKSNLLKYCGLDTMAMVEIYNELRKLA